MQCSWNGEQPHSLQEINQTIDNLYWLISIIGACIRGRSAFNAVEEYDLIDGKLMCR